MRIVIGLIAVMSMGALSQALATEPEPQSATTGQPAQDASPPAQAAPSPTDLQAGAKAPVVDEKAASATSATKPPVVIKSDKPELTHEEQLLVSRGYKVETHNGEKVFCRREQVLGSRLNEVKKCGTVSQLTQQGNDQRDELRAGQKVKTPGVH
jgi:cytoskeletal protein RodZ